MPKSVDLIVEPSLVKIQGTARVNTKIMRELGLDDRDLAVIRSERRDILVNIFSDPLIENGYIKLREGDMKRLGVEGGENVKMMTHQSLLKRGLTDNFL